MKNISFLCLFIIALLSSCSTEVTGPNFYYEILPVETVTIPEEFAYGETYEISLSYLRPSGCHVFNDFYYLSEENQRTVAIVNTVYTDEVCETFTNEEVEVSFNFQVNNMSPYVFKFWQGEDENGNDLYYIVEVPVTE
ncbi:hypothetical protein [Ichthyenterobacterium magnum]|uniref:Lipoprotein n=1 Tax=Ichthyenterobacterium magnum TaxID=1230530 RepID=A0A420DXF9_9FLAO|nr:hypothetical protein [Ichthyenterobacterium magnum]RKE98887.1 hypothetical protein BXY80_0982 [Ichthyenterobacterium magnum]